MIPLHVHSYHTLLKGTISTERLISKAVEYNLKAIAITDTNSMQGVIQFVKQARENKIKPIIGCTINDIPDDNIYVIFLAKNNKGYSDICKLITARKLNDDFSLINTVQNYLPNLFILSPSIEIAKSVNKKNDFYLELITTKKEKSKNRRRFEFAKNNDIRIVATNPVYFQELEDYKIHKAVTAIRLNSSIDNLTEDDIVDEGFYFKDPKLVESKWGSVPETLKASEQIAAKCDTDLKLNEYKFPSYLLPPGETSDSLLWQETFKGLKKNYLDITDDIQKRLEMELSVIKEMGFCDYFLIVWDIVNEAKRRGMLTIGRGSAANSLAAYCLGITQIDPIEQNLYFERFLNKARTSPPDFDIDFSWKERDEIIKYIFEKYGYENVAMISTIVTFRARSAFRETAKAYGFTNTEISRFSRRIPWTSARNLPNLSKLFPESKGLNFNIEPWKTIVNIASKIAGFPRHISIHPGGIVITPTKITDYVALEYAKNKGLGLIVTQPDMYSIEDLGLIKIDILSQRSLGVLRDTMESIKNNSE